MSTRWPRSGGPPGDRQVQADTPCTAGSGTVGGQQDRRRIPRSCWPSCAGRCPAQFDLRARTGEGLDRLRARLGEMVEPREVVVDVTIPYARATWWPPARRGRIDATDHTGGRDRVKARVPAALTTAVAGLRDALTARPRAANHPVGLSSVTDRVHSAGGPPPWLAPSNALRALFEAEHELFPAVPTGRFLDNTSRRCRPVGKGQDRRPRRLAGGPASRASRNGGAEEYGGGGER